MSGKDYGIESITDAFLALRDVEDDIEIKSNAKRKGLKEAASVDVRNPEDIDLAQNFRKTDKKEEDSELEVIDVDADSVENLQDGKSYIGKMLLQCNSCKATRFIDVDKLLADENDKDLYNIDDECPHCHNKGTGYALIGQVGKTTEENPEDEAALDNTVNSEEEAMFDNTDEVEPEAEENNEEQPAEESEESSVEETGYDETNSEDDTNDMELPELGDEFDVDDVMEDDTEDNDEEDKTKKESLQEDVDQDDDEEDFDKFYYEGILIRYNPYQIDKQDVIELLDEMSSSYTEDVMGAEEIDFTPETLNGYAYFTIDGEPFEFVNHRLYDFDPDESWRDEDFDESLNEKLDMATFEGSIANLIDTFTIEDNPVNIKLLNKNGSELGMYSSDDLPFNVKSQMMDTFNTDDNYLEVNITEAEEENGTTVNDLFTYYRPDENNQTTFIVTNVDTDEEEDFEDLTEFLETYGDNYIVGALGLRTLNIYIADGDLETEVEPLDDEDIEELGKENAEKEEAEAEVTEESLIEEIIKSYPGLKLNRINNTLSEEYFIADSIRLNEDIDLVYKNFVKPTNNQKLIEHFKSYTGYEDEVDKFLKEHNISREKYDLVINEDVKEAKPINESFIWTLGLCAEKAAKFAEDQGAVLCDENGNELDRNKPESIKALVSPYLHNENGNNNIVVRYIATDKIGDPSAIQTKEFTMDDLLYYDMPKEVEEKLLTSVKNRAELGEAINKLVSANEKYRIAKSLTEGYRYDIFVNKNCKLTESLFDPEDADDEIEILNDDSNVDNVDTELVDTTPTTDVEEPVETTDIVPEGMNPEDVEVVQKIDRIATDICNAIQDAYGLDVSDKKNLVVADIIQDLQLIGGEKVVDDLEDTPINELTKQMYQEFNGFYDAMDQLISFFTGQRITTSQAERLQQAINSLDSEQFTTETIYQQIASPRFLQAAQQGYIPFIDAAQLEAPVDESLNEETDFNVEDFDECVNEFLSSDSATEDNVVYRTEKVENLAEGYSIKGIIEGLEKDQNITFTLKPVLNESKQFTNKYIVTNDVNNNKFNLDL